MPRRWTVLGHHAGRWARADQIHGRHVDRALPTREGLPSRASGLLPAWEEPGSLCAAGSFDGYCGAANTRYSEAFGWSSRTSHEARRFCRDGCYRRVRWDLPGDLAAELLYAVGADISDRKPPVEEARVPVGTWVHDIRACTLTWSDELYAMYGLPVGAAVTDALIRSRIHEQDRPLVDGTWRAALVDGDAHWTRFRAVWPEGTVRHLDSTGRVIARHGNQALTIRGITLDVTDRPG
jgi:PAS domain-containing protein